MKHISKLFTSGIIILSFFSVVLGGSCDSLEAIKDDYEDEFGECMIECRETDTQENCLRYDCEYEYEDYLEAEEEYNECIACLSCTNGQCCETCDNSDWCNERDIRSWVSRCPEIPSSAITETTAPYLIEEDGHCCFEEIDNTYNCANWGIIPEKQQQCPDIANQINADNVDYVQTRNGYCCFDGGSINSDYSCSLLDMVHTTQSQCQAISSSITPDNIDNVTIEDGYCCFNESSFGDLRCPVQQAKYLCPEIASHITLANNYLLNLDTCCFPPEETNNCQDLGSNFIDDGECCIVGEECDKFPTNGQCESGFKLEGVCCVEMPCEEVNSEAAEKCNQRRANGEAVIWNNCKCECDPAKGCCGVQLNVPLPFIGDCIEMTTSNSTAGSRTGSTAVNQLNAFPYLIKGITKILVTLIMIFSIIVVIVAGLMMTTSVASEQNYKTGLEYLKKVLISLILLGTSGLILKLINPSFFGG